MTRLLDLLIIGVTTGSLYALITVSFGLIFNATHIFNLTHAGVLCVGGYVAYTVSVNNNLPLVVGFAVGLLAAIVLGVASEVVVFGPLRARGSDTRAMFLMSVGLLTVIEGALGAIYGPGALAFNSLPDSAVAVAGVEVPWANIWMLVAWPIVLVVGAYLKWTASGRVLRAISDDWKTAQAMGISTGRYYKLAFAIGSALTVPFVILFSWQNGLLPTMGLSPLLIASAAVILGGRQSLIAGCIWALILGIVAAGSTEFVSATWQTAIVFGVTLMVLFGKSVLSEGSLLVGEANS